MCLHKERALDSQGYRMEGCHCLRATAAGICRQEQLGKGARSMQQVRVGCTGAHLHRLPQPHFLQAVGIIMRLGRYLWVK